MKKLWTYMRGYRRDCVLSPLFKLLEALLELMIPLIVKDIIDNGVGSGDAAYIWRSCGLMALLGAIGLVFSITAQYFSARASVGFASRVRRELFAHTMALPRAEADAAGSSSLVTRLTADADKLQSGVNLGLRLLLRSPFVVFGAMIMAFTVDSRAALWFAARRKGQTMAQRKASTAKVNRREKSGQKSQPASPTAQNSEAIKAMP